MKYLNLLLVFCVIGLFSCIFTLASAMASNTTIDGQLLMAGSSSNDIRFMTKSIQGTDTYPQIIWYNSNGTNYNAIMGAHEIMGNGKIHNHFMLRMACADRVRINCGRIDYEFGKDHPEFKVTRTQMLIKKSSELVIESPNGKPWRLAVDDYGSFSVVPYEHGR